MGKANGQQQAEVADASVAVATGQKRTFAQDLLELVVKAGIVAAAAFTLFTFVFGLYRVGDLSMMPALHDADLVFFYRLDKHYTASQLAVFENEGKLTCGRVVAVGGDEVNIDSRGLLVNGAYQQEPNITKDTTQVAGGVTFPLTVPAGSVFVLGDNRTGAIDSRIVGCIPTDDTLGMVVGIFRRRAF
ncbi:MAG: signal peptidase I [Coriobacteriales bacterium]|nr:signal peptidase I [Coriobacteriales bacterium]